jgi:hypothetical protein
MRDDYKDASSLIALAEEKLAAAEPVSTLPSPAPEPGDRPQAPISAAAVPSNWLRMGAPIISALLLLFGAIIASSMLGLGPFAKPTPTLTAPQITDCAFEPTGLFAGVQEFEQGVIFRDSDGRIQGRVYVLFFEKDSLALEEEVAEGTFVRDRY